MTSYRRINSRTLNRSVSQQDNMVNFMKPISNAIYPNTQIVAGQRTLPMLIQLRLQAIFLLG